MSASPGITSSGKTSVRPVEITHRGRFRSRRTSQFTESVIREMTRLAIEHDAVNLAQGFPDFGAPEEIKRAAQDAIAADFNQYAITWGAKPFRDAIAAKYRKWYGIDYDPEREITVCCGATEGMIAALLAVTNPGDEIIIFEPYYENYGPDAFLCDAERKLVRLRPPDWSFDPDELRRAFSSKTKAIILNSPNNPTGKVFTRAELQVIADLCNEFDALAITDEIYEHIIYEGASHLPIATLPGMRERTVLVNSMSKTYSVTGWRVGFVLAAPDLDGFHSKGPRLSNGGRGGSFTTSRRDGFEPTGFILRKTKCGIPEAKRYSIGAFRTSGISMLSSAWRLLHHDRHQRVRLRG